MTTTMREAFVDTLVDALDTDPRVSLVLADISADRFVDVGARHPDRVHNVGIREQLLVGVAGGLALAGQRPVIHTIAPFLLERAYEQVKLDLGHQGVGALLVSIGASYDYAEAGRTHQGPADVALLDTLPGWTVHLPGHPDQVPGLVRAALAGDDPVYLRLSERADATALPAGTTVVRRGRDAVVLAIGPVLDAVRAATAHRDVTVLWTSHARPLDVESLRREVAALDRADVLVVEPVLRGTSTAVVSDALADRPHRIAAVGVRRDVEVRAYGTAAEHDTIHGLDAAGIDAALHALVGVYAR